MRPVIEGIMATKMTGRILFIDDDLAGREVALFNLRKAGYEVTAPSDGKPLNEDLYGFNLGYTIAFREL